MRKFLLLMCFAVLYFGQLQAQTRTIAGKITDANGAPLPSVSVVIKGSKRGTSSGQDGSFVIAIPAGAKALVFSSVGFASKEVAITDDNTITVQLETAQKNDLQDVVVVGYGTQRKKDVTGSIYKLKDSVMDDLPIQGPDQALRGKVPGVVVTQSSGTPGASINVLIRGAGTISTSSQPLYVVDGVILNTGSYSQIDAGGQETNVLSDLNPNDIESYEVLKDAAAAAVYGSRGANGVVLITTKKGANQKTKVDINGSYGTQSPWRKIPTLTGPQYITLMQEEVNNYGIALGAGPGIKPSQVGYAGLDNDPSTYPTTNWQDLVFRNAPLYNYQVSLAGGNDKTKFYVSANYSGQDGILIGSDYKRYGARINLDHNVSSKFKISGGMGVTRSIQNRINNDNNIYGVLSTAVLSASYYKPYNPDGTYAYDPNNGILENPIASGKLRYNQAKTNSVIGNLAGEYFFLPSLSLRVQGSVDYVGFNEARFLPSNTVEGASGPNGIGDEAYSSDLNLLNENILTWRQSFGDHHITATAVASYQLDNFESLLGEGHNFPGNGIQRLSAASTPTILTSDGNNLGTIGYLFRANYDYQEKYFLGFSVRRDGSSALGSQFRWGTFPAISGAWRASQEDWFPKNNTISDLKLRGSYGKLGNTNGLNRYASLPLVGVGTNYVLNGGSNVPGLAPSQIGNDSLKWESLKQADIGLDVALFKNRLTLTVDWYNKITNDLLLGRPLVGSSGFTSVEENIGEITNKGFEFGITSTNIATPKFVWTTSFNIAFNKNKVVRISGSAFPDGFASWVQQGYPIGSFYGYKVQGIFQSADQVTKAPAQTQFTSPGDIQFKDINSDGVIDSKDQEVLGNANPKFSGGLTNTLSYGGFELNFFLQFVSGNKIWNANRQFAEGMNGSFGQYETTAGRWETNHTNTNMPRAILGDLPNNTRNSDRFLEDGSYLRLKNVLLAYSLPKTLVSKWKISSLKFFVQAQNLKTWTKYSGFDPEVSSFSITNTSPGTDFLTYPQARSFTFGLNMGL